MVTKDTGNGSPYVAAKLESIERQLAELREHVTRGKRSKPIRNPRGMMKGTVDIEDIKAVRRELFKREIDE